MPLVVRFLDISEAGVSFEVLDNSWVPSELVLPEGEVHAELFLTRKSPSEIEVRGHLDVPVQLTCDRCLVVFAKRVESDVQLILRCGAEEQWQLHETECTSEDLEIVNLSEPVVDLGDILRQQLYLSLPAKQLCAENCRGLCKKCGINLNERGCDCLTGEENSPFAALARLKNKE